MSQGSLLKESRPLILIALNKTPGNLYLLEQKNGVTSDIVNKVMDIFKFFSPFLIYYRNNC